MSDDIFTVEMNTKAAMDELGVDAFQLSRAYLLRIGKVAKAAAIRLAKAQLKTDTPTDERRNPESAYYVDSFTIRTTRSSNQLALGLGNTHPAANVIELGSQPHEINPSESDRLAWPASRDKSSGYTEGRVMGIGLPVDHPGTPAYHILASALRSAAQKQRRTARIG